jgi:hypothetical protein
LRLQRIIPGLVLAVAPFLYAAQARPQTQIAAQTILRLEDHWLHAKTAQEAAHFLASDFVGVSTRGAIETREQRLARSRPPPQCTLSA